MAARIVLLLLVVAFAGCKGEPPQPAKVQNSNTSKKRGMLDFSDRPAPAGVQTGTPGG